MWTFVCKHAETNYSLELFGKSNYVEQCFESMRILIAPL